MAGTGSQPPIPPLDDDDPKYIRGFVLGLVWEAARRDRFIQVELDPPCTEMVVRIADALGLPFDVDPIGEDWLQVTIGTREAPCPT